MWTFFFFFLLLPVYAGRNEWTREDDCVPNPFSWGKLQQRGDDFDWVYFGN